MVKKQTNNPIQYFSTDLHTHILPGMDDGAENLDISLEMLRKLKSRGVERVALTPHFFSEEELSAFLDRRATAYEKLISAWDEQTMPQLQLGAEVRYTPAITELDLRKITFENSNYLLLELPGLGMSTLTEQVIDAILQQGITPVLAHVERCMAFRKDPDLLLKFVQAGAIAQVSIGALVGKADSFAEACLQNGLAQVIASDVHNLHDRFRLFDDAAAKVYAEIIQWTEAFSRAIWDNTPLPAFSFTPVRKGLLRYR